jgi:hypothetical protein
MSKAAPVQSKYLTNISSHNGFCAGVTKSGKATKNEVCLFRVATTSSDIFNNCIADEYKIIKRPGGIEPGPPTVTTMIPILGIVVDKYVGAFKEMEGGVKTHEFEHKANLSKYTDKMKTFHGLLTKKGPILTSVAGLMVTKKSIKMGGSNPDAMQMHARLTNIFDLMCEGCDKDDETKAVLVGMFATVVAAHAQNIASALPKVTKVDTAVFLPAADNELDTRSSLYAQPYTPYVDTVDDKLLAGFWASVMTKVGELCDGCDLATKDGPAAACAKIAEYYFPEYTLDADAAWNMWETKSTKQITLAKQMQTTMNAQIIVSQLFFPYSACAAHMASSKETGKYVLFKREGVCMYEAMAHKNNDAPSLQIKATCAEP